MAARSTTIKDSTSAVTFSDTDDWGSGFVGNVGIVNTSGKILNGWTLTFTLADNITSIWNAVIVSHVGNTYVIENASWDAAIGNNGTVSFGFQANGGDPVFPSSYILNGDTVGTSPPPPPPPPPPPLPAISVADAAVNEGNPGSHQEAFVVTLSAPSTQTVTVAFATADGSAHAGTDYTADSGVLIFAAGVTTETIDIATMPGLSPTETFTLNLSNPVNATVARGQATGTITNPGTTQPTVGWAPAWLPNAVYTGGMRASENNLVYQANWWTEGNDPATNSAPVGGGEPWTMIGTLAPITSPPTVPTGLASTGVSSHMTWLSWNASTVPGGSPVSDYAVFENGTQIATTTGTAIAIANLSPSTTYQFTVDAVNSVGASAQSTAAAVTTLASPGNMGVFAPYIDMGLAQDSNLLAISQASGIQTFTLAFLQSSGPGTVGWAGTGTIDQDTLQDGSTIQSQIQALRAAGGNVIISFGGEAGTDPAAVATSAQQLQAEYQSVINRYGVNSLDFDIEGAEVADTHAMALRDQALVGLKAANPGLQISFTLPVLPTGLDNNGMNVLQTAKADGLTPDVVNLMAMDYGASVDNGGQMGADAISAALGTEQQLSFIGLDSKIGITPMIGVNDVTPETFTLADAQSLLSFAQHDSNVARLSMWSVARDNGNAAGTPWALDDSSGIAQSPYQFASIFKQV